ncbi:hypothetical protein IT570_08425 [Candidatus Sumerlaeota bacterium]|nr:hypothetical protein [Candidatus Sumerlaeota bacterium]
MAKIPRNGGEGRRGCDGCSWKFRSKWREKQIPQRRAKASTNEEKQQYRNPSKKGAEAKSLLPVSANLQRN